ncbi:D-alanine transaminase [Andreprevotia lacus DSM 23236]|jgi:D-alanine transaminase|uniref:D-alanine transaminase n=1 Tax=Andreprevotia lacus DSM 23236 TaxID=1121001 RepID=A0A1W1XYD9_9NEIS|nr:D-amino acid aminotransferase [Andreprevotia lacus]SMC28528.1 D-alanine transaminase [Andreprevotia lacus DSM 23236]
MADWPDMIAYLNGSFAPLAQLQVPVLDRGFLFGDGVYEMIPVYARQPFRLAEHLRRLQHSLDAVRIANPHSEAEWTAIVGELVAQQDFADQSIYLQVTRGAAYPRNHAFPADSTPTVFLFADPLTTPSATLLAQGVAAVTQADVRWLRCNIKAISLLANVLAKQHAVDEDVAETILIRDGLMIEGSASNIFVVRDGVILAPPPSHLMLTGITYDLIIELAQQHDMPLQACEISADELRAADEVWLTSSSKEVLAIVTLDGRPVGNGVPGPIYKAMYAHYAAFKTGVMQQGKDY